MDDYITGSALGDIDMELHDISQYLLRALGDSREAFQIDPPWVNPDDKEKETTDPDEILRRAKMTKDLAIKVAGGEPLPWGGFDLGEEDEI